MLDKGRLACYIIGMMKIKIGDLVSVQHPGDGCAIHEPPLLTIVTGIDESANHPNKLQLVQVLERDGHAAWYPIGYIKVENESR